jgi:hypothetical protein
VLKAFPVGVEKLLAMPKTCAVYNLSGVKVGKVGDLNKLPKGIYIMNRKTFLVK